MKLLYILPFLFISLSCGAQKENVSKNSDELVWHTDMNKAISISKKENKPMLLFFTGSDWCGWCIRLQNEVFKKEEFTTWAKDNVVLVELDFPRSKAQSEEIKQQNNQLQQTFAVQGYPTVFFVTAEKTENNKYNLNSLGKSGYMQGGPETWIANANTFLQKK